MASEVYITAEFECDLFDSLAYLTEVLHASGAAERLANEIDAAKELLAEHPFLDAVSERLQMADLGYREHLVLNYVIVYKVKNNVVWFLRLFHQRQSYGRFIIEWR
ncbi:type II toxin-antitoxin system RelE/ParE family toxin [Eggerthella sp. YY7918]|uniref:type II toxin-antitoxin system RelE/ParE family toxin n=1 Tax=Eggerthella sp. (strain YY7918) TaxID=502558 RepID=UPI0002171015|nr:type II toxin-antitoxin system RelE/ParE family toxin [Eggerthella sp. YY7918]BAK43780.1 hypothetical protein EGYY_05670 [Eggerthella sp. YY7918]